MVKGIIARKPQMSTQKKAKIAPKSGTSQPSEKSQGHLSLKLKQRPGTVAKERSAPVDQSKKGSEAKTSAKNSLSPNEIRVTSDGVKVIDFYPDNDEEDKCIINHELKEYERENRHRFVPRNLGQKNLALHSKIDRDIE